MKGMFTSIQTDVLRVLELTSEKHVAREQSQTLIAVVCPEV